MRIVAALGGNALLERGEPPESSIQEAHVIRAVRALAPLAAGNDLVITHGNGPQVGMLALESEHDPSISRPYPFDVLGAQTQGMIGYWLVQALQNALPGRQVACLVSRTLVAAADPAFAQPSKFVGPVYDEQQARALAASMHWEIRQDGTRWRRVVPSPEPAGLLDLPAIRLLLDHQAIVVCSGGGGVPVIAGNGAGPMRGVEAVVDKDLTASLLARHLDADALLLLTDVAAVEDGYGTPQARPIRRATPAGLRGRSFPAGSMGPKIEAVCRFVEATGKPAAIGQLGDAQGLLAGEAGTLVTAS
jgi:carbamate kinase